jgi:hypothetical protein
MVEPASNSHEIDCANGPRFPPAPKLRKNLNKDKRHSVFQPHSLLKEVGERAFGYGSLPGVERRFHAQLWKALPCRTADLNRVRRIGSQRDCRQTNGEEATDEMEPAHCPEFPRRPDSRAERHLGKCIPVVAPGISANRGSVPGPGRSLITHNFACSQTGPPAGTVSTHSTPN